MLEHSFGEIPIPLENSVRLRTASSFESVAVRLRQKAPPETLDKGNIAYFSLDPDSLTYQVVYAINHSHGESPSRKSRCAPLGRTSFCDEAMVAMETRTMIPYVGGATGVP